MDLLGGAAVLTILAAAGPATAQTAADINRLNAAMQICNSPAGATMAECAQLRARMGMRAGPSVSLPGGGLAALAGGDGTAAAARIFGLLGQARHAAPAAGATSTSAVNPAAVQEAIRMCVQNANGDATAIQACLQIATAAQPGAGATRPSLGIAAYQTPAR